jgi:hypothetical protein
LYTNIHGPSSYRILISPNNSSGKAIPFFDPVGFSQRDIQQKRRLSAVRIIGV